MRLDRAPIADDDGVGDHTGGVVRVSFLLGRRASGISGRRVARNDDGAPLGVIADARSASCSINVPKDVPVSIVEVVGGFAVGAVHLAQQPPAVVVISDM